VCENLPGMKNRMFSVVSAWAFGLLETFLCCYSKKKTPTDIIVSIECGKTLDILDGHDGVVSLRPHPFKKRWVVHTRDKGSAESLVATATIRFNLFSHVLNRKVFGIVSDIPAGVLKSELINMIPRFVETMKIGSSGSLRLQFLDHGALNKVMSDCLRWGYKLFGIRPYQKLHLPLPLPLSIAEPRCR